MRRDEKLYQAGEYEVIPEPQGPRKRIFARMCELFGGVGFRVTPLDRCVDVDREYPEVGHLTCPSCDGVMEQTSGGYWECRGCGYKFWG